MSIETCHICGEAKPLHLDPDGGAMLCDDCQQLLDMGPEWISNAIRYLGEYEERKTVLAEAEATRKEVVERLYGKGSD